MVVLTGLEVLGSIQILHNHSLGMGLMGRGDGWEGGLMRGCYAGLWNQGVFQYYIML